MDRQSLIRIPAPSIRSGSRNRGASFLRRIDARCSPRFREAELVSHGLVSQVSAMPQIRSRARRPSRTAGIPGPPAHRASGNLLGPGPGCRGRYITGAAPGPLRTNGSVKELYVPFGIARHSRYGPASGALVAVGPGRASSTKASDARFGPLFRGVATCSIRSAAVWIQRQIAAGTGVTAAAHRRAVNHHGGRVPGGIHQDGDGFGTGAPGASGPDRLHAKAA